jgi:NADH:ubiquinone oxidoreductase subunit 6 (subunit J)
MTATLLILGALVAGAAIAAMSLRNLVHCALALAVSLGGLAAVYLQLDAQFAGFAQFLVYVGAVAILVVFAILLTRGSETTPEPIASGSWAIGLCVAVVVFGVLAGVILTSGALRHEMPPVPEATVRQIGDQLMTFYILPLEVIGLLLTAALIGAVIIAIKEKETE